jgi:hypothetical protein
MKKIFLVLALAFERRDGLTRNDRHDRERAPNSEGLRRNPNRNLVDPSQLGYRQAYRFFKLTVANVARPRVSNAMSGYVLRPFRCDYLRTTLRTLTAK